MIYAIVEEASEAVCGYTTVLEEAIEDAKSRQGKYLVLDDSDKTVFDSQPGVSYKI